jgi:dTDP-D-glucose 4,6-dehydratase
MKIIVTGGAEFIGANFLNLDMKAVDAVFDEVDPDLVVYFTAESHVDRSMHGPREFIRTNIEGTFNLLEACRKRWTGSDQRLFYQVSTDEVYGSRGETGFFLKTTAMTPRARTPRRRRRAIISSGLIIAPMGFR